MLFVCVKQVGVCAWVWLTEDHKNEHAPVGDTLLTFITYESKRKKEKDEKNVWHFIDLNNTAVMSIFGKTKWGNPRIFTIFSDSHLNLTSTYNMYDVSNKMEYIYHDHYLDTDWLFIEYNIQSKKKSIENGKLQRNRIEIYFTFLKICDNCWFFFKSKFQVWNSICYNFNFMLSDIFLHYWYIFDTV